MEPKNMATIVLLSMWVSTLTLYAEPSSRVKEDEARLPNTITSLTTQLSRIGMELHDAEERLQGFSGDNRIDLEEWLQAYSERIIQLKKNYVEMIENDDAAKRKPEGGETLETAELIKRLQAQRAEMLKKEHEYLKLERNVERLQNLTDWVLTRLKEIDILGANKPLEATGVPSAPQR